LIEVIEIIEIIEVIEVIELMMIIKKYLIDKSNQEKITRKS